MIKSRIAVLVLLLGCVNVFAGIPFPDRIIRNAINEDLIVCSPDGGDNYLDGQRRGTAMFILAVASYYNEDQEAGTGISVKDRLMEHVSSVLTGGQEPACRGYLYGRIDNSIAQSLLLVRKKDSLWSALTTDQQERCDLLMECFAITANWCYNSANNFNVDLAQEGTWIKTWNPNIQEGYVGALIAAVEYFGADNLNAKLAAFDYDAVMTRLTAKSFTNIIQIWQITGKTMMESGGTDAEGGTGLGAKREFVMDDWVTGNPVALDSWALYYALSTKMYYHTVVNDGANGQAYIDSGSSPVLGQFGMMFEFDAYDANGRRSDANYCYDGWKNNVITHVALRMVGGYDTGTAGQEIMDNMTVGSTDLLYKLKMGYHSWSLGKATFHDESWPYAFPYLKSLWVDYLNIYDSWEFPGEALPENSFNEAEDLDYTYQGNWVSLTSASLASGGQYHRFSSYGNGCWIEYTLPAVVKGVYTLDLTALEHSYGGIYQLQVNGEDVGSPVDYYSASSSFNSYEFTDITIDSEEPVVVRFVNTGQNTASNGARMMADAFELQYTAPVVYAYECEDLTYDYQGSWVSYTTSSLADNGAYLRFSSYGDGCWIDLTVPDVPAGTYNLDLKAFMHTYNGIYQLQVGGSNIGTEIDFYAASTSLQTFSYTGIVADGTSDLVLRFLNVGQNAEASAARIMPDSIKLTSTLGTVSYDYPDSYYHELEDLTRSYYNGSIGTYTSSYASAGAYDRFNAYGSGSWLEYTLPNVDAGLYKIDLGVQEHSYAGIYEVQINGVTVSDPIDFYYAGGEFCEYQLRNISVATSGPLTVRFVCTGKNASAYSYRMLADSIVLTPIDLWSAEDLTTSVSDGSTTTVTSSEADNGAYELYTGSASGSWIEYTLTDVLPGNYELVMGSLSSITYSPVDITVNGVVVTDPEITSAGSLVEYNFGRVPVSAAGPVVVRLTFNDELPSNYSIASDYFSLAP